VAAAKTKKLSFISAGFTSLPDVILIGSELQGMIFSFVYFLLFLPTSEINLDYNRLTSVPKELFLLPNLKKLSLQHNYLNVLPEAGILDSKKLSSVELVGNPLAYPPSAIVAKGWAAVKKWAAANPNFVMYRLYHSPRDGLLSYTDFNICTVRDTMVKSKDEDRDMTYINVDGVPDPIKLPVINRHKMDPKPGAMQKEAGWCSAPNETGVHLRIIDHVYFSIFDGHCGPWVAQALTTNLYKKLNEAKVFTEKVDYEPVVRKVFMDLDKVICDKLRAEKWNDGSTCVTVSFKSNGDVIAAHVGDSRASARVNKKDVQLTEDHDPGASKAEKERVEARGAKVEFVKGCWRINANLSVSRAFGDTNLSELLFANVCFFGSYITPFLEVGDKPIVDADPDVLVQHINPEMDWLIVASDGLWHLMDNADVIKLAAGKLTAEEAALALMSEIDTNTRSQLKGHDNTTIIAGFLFFFFTFFFFLFLFSPFVSWRGFRRDTSQGAIFEELRRRGN
jgi:protein phosphatase 1L